MNKYPHFCYKETNQTSEHYRFCKDHSIPYIAIRKRRKYAAIELDLITFPCGYFLDEDQQQLVKEIFEESGAIVKSFGTLYFIVDKIPVKKAEQVAEAVYQIASGPKHQQPM